VEGKECRLLNRRRIDMADRYPEFACLAGFPAGTVLDGETVVLRDGKLMLRMPAPSCTQRLPSKDAHRAASRGAGVRTDRLAMGLLYERD